MSAPASPDLPPVGATRSGMRQSLRVLFFVGAAAAFVLCTYLAFFRAPLPPPNAARPGFFSAAWWLRPIEFNPDGRLHHVGPGVDFTCISALPMVARFGLAEATGCSSTAPMADEPGDNCLSSRLAGAGFRATTTDIAPVKLSRAETPQRAERDHSRRHAGADTATGCQKIFPPTK